MTLSDTLYREFAKATTTDISNNQDGTILYGTVMIEDNTVYVQIDGSTINTPASTTVAVQQDDRVIVIFKARSAVIIGNLTVPSGSVEQDVSGNGAKGDSAAVLKITSSNGLLFKNNDMSTVLSVAVYYGSERITDIVSLKSIFGNSAYLEWSWKNTSSDTYGVLSSKDSRLSDSGFILTLSQDDTDPQFTFICALCI